MVSHGQLPINRGFDESLAMLGGGSDHFTNSIGFAVDLWFNDRPAHDVSRSNTSADERYTDFMVRAIETHDPNRPLFAWLSLQDVHEPLGQAPARFADKVGATFCAVSGHPIQCGWAMLAEADEMVGRVESALKGRGMWERTLMLVTSDKCAAAPLPSGTRRYPLLSGCACTCGETMQRWSRNARVQCSVTWLQRDRL